MLAALHGHVKGHLGNPADLLLGILLDVVGGGAQVCVLHALFPEVDAAGELPNHHDVQAAGQNFRLQGGGVRQLFKEQGGAEVGKQAQGLAQTQQSPLRPLVPGEGVPLPTAHSPQQDRVGGFAHIDGFLGQAAAGGVDGTASRQDLVVLEGVAKFFPYLVQHQQGLLHHVGADAVPGNDREFIVHGSQPSCLFLISAMRPPA